MICFFCTNIVVVFTIMNYTARSSYLIFLLPSYWYNTYSRPEWKELHFSIKRTINMSVLDGYDVLLNVCII
jgi:hypothetical protein